MKLFNRSIVEPNPPPSLLGVLATLAPLQETFPRVTELPVDPVELDAHAFGEGAPQL